MTDIGSTAPITFTGIESGLDTEQIMSAYLQIDEAPLTQLEDQQTTVNNQVSAYQTIEQQLQALQTAADQVSAPDAFSSAVTASSSDSSVGYRDHQRQGPRRARRPSRQPARHGRHARLERHGRFGQRRRRERRPSPGLGRLRARYRVDLRHRASSGAHTIAVTQASAGASIAGTSAAR